MEIIFLTSVESYVRSLSRPDLLDLLVHPASEDVIMVEVEDLRPSKRKIIYPEVLLLSLHAFHAIESCYKQHENNLCF